MHGTAVKAFITNYVSYRFVAKVMHSKAILDSRKPAPVIAFETHN